jgi:hypothetical protein
MEAAQVTPSSHRIRNPMSREQLPNVWAYFDLKGKTFDPDEVTRRVGFTPNAAHRQGDRLGPGPGKHRSDAWAHCVGPRRTLDLDQLVEELLSELRPYSGALAKARQDLGLTADIFCAVYLYSDLTPNIIFSQDVVSWAHSVGAGIWVDLYVVFGEE